MAGPLQAPILAPRSVGMAWCPRQDPESLIATMVTMKQEMAVIRGAKLNLGSAAAEALSTSQTSAWRSAVMDSISASSNAMTATTLMEMGKLLSHLILKVLEFVHS